MAKIKNLLFKLWVFFNRLSLPKKTVVIIALIILIIFLYQQINRMFQQDGYITEKARISSITEVVSETGNIITAGKVDVYSPATGIVKEIKVQNGDSVKKGQELFKVESNATVQEQQAAYADYLTAKSTLDADKAELYSLQSTMYSKWKIYKDIATNSTYENSDGSPKDSNRVLTEFTTAQDNWLAAEANYKNQQGVIAMDQADANSTWLLYQATQNSTTLAQSDGVVSNLSVGTGDFVKANTSTVLSIADFSKYVVKAPLNESSISKVKPGQKVIIEPDAYKNTKYQARVVRVDNIGTNNNGVIKYNVYMEIDNPDDKLKFGMTVDADITTKTLENILAVPNSAVKPYLGGKAVRIYNKQTNKLEFIKVEAGIKGDKETQILSGITEGQEIVTSLKNEMVQRKGMFGF